MKIKHFIITRFLNADWGYGDLVFDPGFIHYHANLLINNFFKSLENQNNHNFEIIVIIHNNVELEKLQEITHLDTSIKYNLIRQKDVDKYLNEYDYHSYDYCIVSRMDDDDFARYDCVEDIQRQCSKCVNIIYGYGYNHGYVGFEDEDKVLEFDKTYDSGHFSILQSYIFDLSKTQDIVSPYSYNHTQIIQRCIRPYLESHGEHYKRNLNIGFGLQRCFVWYRHKYTGTEHNGQYPMIAPKYLNAKPTQINKHDYGWN